MCQIEVHVIDCTQNECIVVHVYVIGLNKAEVDYLVIEDCNDDKLIQAIETFNTKHGYHPDVIALCPRPDNNILADARTDYASRFKPEDYN